MAVHPVVEEDGIPGRLEPEVRVDPDGVKEREASSGWEWFSRIWKPPMKRPPTVGRASATVTESPAPASVMAAVKAGWTGPRRSGWGESGIEAPASRLMGESVNGDLAANRVFRFPD